jgi:DNA-directed RNA polymerase subunit RPC12/RpoP
MAEAPRGDSIHHRETPLDGLVEVVCLCGEIVFVTRNTVDRVYECHGCTRKFSVFTQRSAQGAPIAVPMFLNPQEDPPEVQLPEPPEDMMLLCTCGNPLRITRKLYNHRVQCPHCNSRMALLLTFDTSHQKYRIEARKISAPSMGDTHVLARSGV